MSSDGCGVVWNLCCVQSTILGVFCFRFPMGLSRTASVYMK